MKLAALNVAIRNREGPVLMTVGPLTVGLVKSMLLASLKDVYGTGRTTETEFVLGADGYLRAESDGSEADDDLFDTDEDLF